MAPEPDTESQKLSNEQTPLLADQALSSSSSSSSSTNQPDDNVPQPSPRQRSWYLWRIFWVTITAFVLGVFIKGWIDAGGDVNFDLGKALKRALGGGLSGAAAMVLQVLLLMPLRTIMNHQYRFGGTFGGTARTLRAEGGLARYYQGLGAALVQGPVARFGDTAANAGILALLASNAYLKDLPSPVKTVFASLCAAGFRIVLTPIDTLKTTLQTQGARGTALLRRRVKVHGLGGLYWGAIATAAATFVGHYPWFATACFSPYNYLSEALPKVPETGPLILWLLRLALIGFVASVVSDSSSNSLRVVKTYCQVDDAKVSYFEAARLIVQANGVSGLFGRGLKTRILCNGLQGILFTILWKLFLDL
ncbi:mitochondrial carrier domain-containing protein [Lasiosphaeris hirsuta]|uniref:Mitochondrial carrier domain-containing protein n=1 Tax=Lasiosphaeris hirsuta TaxID=260670 RepID=A0AA40AHY6_9PEZI|nr:mitochondrial carrier domain-containing protein [Lasiosphaeris hirsuta]